MPLDTTPAYPLPAESEIEAAARDLPNVLAAMKSNAKYANEAPGHQDRLVIAADLVELLATKKGHSEPAAAWATHRKIKANLLVAEIAIKPKSFIATGGRFKETEHAIAAIEERAFDQRNVDGHTTEFPACPLHDGNGPVPYDKLLVRSTERLWAANRAGTIRTQPGFSPNKPRPDRPSIDVAKRVIQQQIFNYSNADGETSPAPPHRVVNGAILLVNCGHQTTHSAFQSAVRELESDGLLRVRPANNPQFVSVIADQGFAVGGRSGRKAADGSIVLGEDETPLGLYVLETTERLFAGELGSSAGSVVQGPLQRSTAFISKTDTSPLAENETTDSVSPDEAAHSEASASTPNVPQSGESASAVKSKRSTQRGDGRTKLIAALSAHHRYADGSALIQEPINSNELGRRAGVSQSTASRFFESAFQGYECYRIICRDPGRLADSLKLLNGEFSPSDLYGRRPPNEDDRDDCDSE